MDNIWRSPPKYLEYCAKQRDAITRELGLAYHGQAGNAAVHSS
jgi:hypothetical protein